MNFVSIVFLFFFGIVFLIYWRIPNKYRWGMLLAASCYFYLGYGLALFLILGGAILVSYLVTLLMHQCNNSSFRKLLLIGVSVGILMFLGYYKYYFFLIENLNKILNVFVIQLHPTIVSIALPVGISFYSFKIWGYIFDVYKGTEPERHFGKYALFIMFFPEISSGPIDRGRNLLPQFSVDHVFNYEKVAYGLKLVSWGLFKKVIIADGIAYWVDSVYDSHEAYRGFVLFIISIFYTIQIYCDFSGYSDMAIGMARMLDIDLCDNFKSPYFSSSIKEFWRKWHISLSSWLRDYIYIPLGGSKKGKIRTNINLMLTFLISGLWHGADWSFIVWGGVHGTAHIIENIGKLLFRGDKESGKFIWTIKTLIVFLFCNFAWIFFRAESMEQAIYFFRFMFVGIDNPLHYMIKGFHDLPFTRIILWKIIILILFVFAFDFKSKEEDVICLISRQKKVIRWIVYCAFVFIMIIFYPVEAGSDFVYFQF